MPCTERARSPFLSQQHHHHHVCKQRINQIYFKISSFILPCLFKLEGGSLGTGLLPLLISYYQTLSLILLSCRSLLRPVWCNLSVSKFSLTDWEVTVFCVNYPLRWRTKWNASCHKHFSVFVCVCGEASLYRHVRYKHKPICPKLYMDIRTLCLYRLRVKSPSGQSHNW